MICPVCGDELSPITKVCPRCGAIVDNDSLSEDLKEIELEIVTMKSCPPVSFGTYYSSKAYLLYALVTVVFLIVAFITDAGLFFLLSLVTAAMAIFGFVKKFFAKKKISNSEEEFNEAKANADALIRLIRQDYGESRDIKNKLNAFHSETNTLNDIHSANKKKAVRVWGIVLVLVIVISVLGIIFLNSAANAA